MKNAFYVLVALFLYAKTTAQPQIQLNTLVSGFTLPLFVTHAGDERLFVLEKLGKIKVIMPNGTVNATPFLDIENIVLASNSVNSERGLLGLAFDPDYKNNGYFYVNYTRESPVNDGATVVARYTVSATDSNVANANSAVILRTVRQPFSNHNGGCTLFGPDGKLYISLGDGGSGNDPENNSQTDSTDLGKMLRINTDGSAPSDNPFVGNSDYSPRIWASGLRNAWRFSFDRITGDSWIADVGQNAWEEVNFQPANSIGGENYGWRCYEGTVFNSGLCANAISNRTDPVYVYDHSNSGGFSVTGGYVGRSAKYKGLWNYYLFADAVSSNMWATQNNNGNFTTTKIMSGTAGSSNVSYGEDVYGDLYLVKHSSGTIQKIEETGTEQPVAYVLNKENIYTLCANTNVLLEALFHPDLSYQWRLNGQDIQNANSANYLVTEAGSYTVKATITGSSTAFPDSSLAITVNFIPTDTQAIVQDTFFADVTDNDFVIPTVANGGSFSGTGVNPAGSFSPSSSGVGEFEIIFSIQDNGCTRRDTALVMVTQAVGLDRNLSLTTINISPNPNKGNFQITASEMIENIMVFDMLGKQVFADNINNYSANIILNTPITGFYFVKINTKNGIVTKKIIIE